MATLLETQVGEVLKRPEALDTNVPNSSRTYYEMLTDETVGDEIKRDVVDSFQKTFITAPPITGQEVRAIDPGDPTYVPPEAPIGDLQPGETIDSEGRISYDPRLEATQSAKFTINIGSLVGGERTAGGTFLPGKPRPNSPTVTFNLPKGMRPDQITNDVWDLMLDYVRERQPQEYQAAKEYDSLLKTAAKAGTREAILGIPALADMPFLLARGADYVISPVGTNTLFQDAFAIGRHFTGLPGSRPRPDSPYLDKDPRILEGLGVYPTDYPHALFQPNVVIHPDKELAPVHQYFGKLLDEALANMEMPEALTPQQETKAQEITAFLSGIMGGSLTITGAARAGAQLAVRGMTAARLQDANVLTKALYSLANSPGVGFAWGGKRRFTIPGGLVFQAKDQFIAGASGAAMLATPDEWGPQGKIIAGLTAPFSLGKIRQGIRALTGGQDLPLVGGLLEPFTSPGQQRLAARYIASIPAMRGNERLVVALLNDLDNAPRKPGQSELVSTPQYFSTVSERLRQAESDWTALRDRGVSDADIIAQLSQNPVYGRYFNEIPMFGDKTPTLESLTEARSGMKGVSDNLYGAMSWLATGSPIKNEVLRASGERLRRAEGIFRDLSEKVSGFERSGPGGGRRAGDPEATSAYVQNALEQLDELARDAVETHSIDALLYNTLREKIADPNILTGDRISAAERALEGVNNAFKEMREIEKALWKHIGADQIQISPENMALIGDKAAEIILNTPVAQRRQIPAFLYSLAGKNRLLSDEALETMAKSVGADVEVPKNIRSTRARLDGLRARRAEAISMEQDKLVKAEDSLREINRQLRNARRRVKNPTQKKQVAALEKKLVAAQEKVDTHKYNIERPTVDKTIAEVEARLAAYEADILPTRTDADEIIDTGPNGLLDNVSTLDEVLATRSTLLDEASRARARTGGANSARMANDVQKYIIEDWLQDSQILGDAGASSAYDVARNFSLQLNQKFTRGTIADFLRTSGDRSPKTDPNQFLTKIIKENQVKPGTLPTGSVDALDVALVEAKAPFLIRGEDGAFVVDPNAALTRGLEDFTWESIREGGPDSPKLSSQLLREEILNRLALVAFDNGILNPTTVERSIQSWAVPIAKVEESYPGFTAELKGMAENSEQLAIRNKAINKPLRSTLDEALASGDLDDVAGAMDAGILSRHAQKDYTVSSVFLDNDPHVVAAQLLANPSKLQTDIGPILKILDADETGAAKAGFQRAMFDELTRKVLGHPETAGRRAGEAILDPAQINDVLMKNESALRQVFDDVAGWGPDGQPITTYDMLKMFNDEMAIGLAERIGISEGTRGTPVTLTVRGNEMVRNLGRIAGVKLASLTGGPALVMAGTGGRLAGKIYERGGQDAIFQLVADALADPYTARLLLTETARLDERGKFVFDKRLTQAVRPYQFYAGPRTQVVREGMEEQRRLDQIEREGGPSEIIYDPEANEYRRQRRDPEVAPVVPTPGVTQEETIINTPTLSSLMPPARPPVAGSTLAQARPLDRQQFAAATPQGAPQQQTMAQLQNLGMPLFASKGGLASLKKKKNSRQMVY